MRNIGTHLLSTDTIIEAQTEFCFQTTEKRTVDSDDGDSADGADATSLERSNFGLFRGMSL